MDYGQKYSTARDRVLAALWPMSWVDWRRLRTAGGVRYGARLRELRRTGFEIEDEADPSGDGKRYRLKSRDPGRPLEKSVKVFLSESDAEKLAHQRLVTDAAAAAVSCALMSFFRNKGAL